MSHRVGCRPSVGSLSVSLWGVTVLKAVAVVHKDRPDVGVFVLQVGEGTVENS